MFQYDAKGRLYQSSKAGVTTRFAYDGINLVAEYSGANALQRRYVSGPGADEPLVWYEGSSTSDRRWFHQDEHGSIVALTNSAATTIAINTYDEYGIPGLSNTGRFAYSGQTWLPEVGLYYYKARIYSPWLGRFLQTDPVGTQDNVNLYAYVGDDPVNRLDPLGLASEELTKDQLVKVVEAAKASKLSPTATAVEIFNKLPTDSTVKGETLKAAMQETNVKLDDTAKALIGKTESISKTGSSVEIKNKESTTIALPDNKTLTIGKTVNFKVDVADGKPTISGIKGITADVGMKVNITKIQAVPGGINVSASKGFVPLPSQHINIPE